MRLFFAVELPDEVQRTLGRLRPDSLQPGARDYRWVEPSLLHVTLAFLGEQPEDALERLRHLGVAATNGHHPLDLSLAEAGSFGPSRAPRVLWAGLGGDLPALATIQTTLGEGLRSGGFPVDDRPFAPHVTLARRRQEARGPLRFEWPPRVPPLPFQVDAIALVLSQLGPKGPTHTALEHFALTA